MKSGWLKVIIAALLEVGWVIGLAHAYNVITWIATIFAIIISNYFMITAGKNLPAGTVYTVFVGLGTAGTVLAEIIFFDEPFRIGKILLILVLLLGVAGLKTVTDEKNETEAAS